MPLEMLGKYERLDVLGHGASGIVYLAKDTLLGKQVALKEISAQGEERHRFLEEARVLDRLRHPNIVRVNGVDEIGGRVVIDMEYVRGRNLQDILRETPQLPVAQAVGIASQVCDGLAYAHAQRTVHRDIKPANILLTREGQVKLVDFGLSAQLGTHSMAGGAGTYAYMAPEDFHPEEQSDRQSDIWAVGVILYEMLAGRRPFQVPKSKDPFAWKQAVENDPIPPVRDLRPDVPPALEAVALRALARDKSGRYREAGAMAADLRAAGGTPEVLSRLAGGSPPFPQREGASDLQEPSELQELPPTSIALPSEGRGASLRRAGIGPPNLPGFPPDMADIDAFLTLAPDHWDAAREALEGGALGGWLRGIGEDPLASVADQVAREPDRDGDDRLRDFLYRAGLDTADEARGAFAEGQRLRESGRGAQALPLLRRATHLDSSRPEYAQYLAAVLRATGDAAGATRILEGVIQDVRGPADQRRRPLQEHGGAAGAQVTLSDTQVNFGVLRRGQSRSCRLTLHNAGGGTFEGRVSAAPGWVRVEPPAFSARRRQTLTLTAVTEAVWSTPASFDESVILETSGGRQEIGVSASILSARLSWALIGAWYVPLLLCAGAPAVAALWSQLHGGAGTALIGQPGFITSGLLYLAVFLLTFAADVTWPPRLLPLGLVGLNAWGVSQTLDRLARADPSARLALVQSVTPVLVLLILQTCAFALDSPGWGNWKIWRWIIGATGLLVAYSLLRVA